MNVKSKNEATLTMTLPHHDTAHGDEGSRGKAPLLRPQKTGDSDVTASTNLTVRLHGDATTKIVQDERLVRLGQTKLPG